ncbi:MAG: septum formation initiator family protein [Candidatus Eisenbacteria bacterium]|uniref:Septum formation initiator family protein n=1 Tax=Eiseniibacteriota bacterium TaxID=2212470 RepID=A0A956LXL0_UNCEI|nr:septum formation initiator family protein [Candidatus Eisenbacteria bacterium]
MDERIRRPQGMPSDRLRQSRDPLVRKYAAYRTTGAAPAAPPSPPPSSPAPAASRPAEMARASRSPVPDRGLRSARSFRTNEQEPEPEAHIRSRGPHGIDPAWYVRSPWKSARRRVLPLLALFGGAWIALSLVFGTSGLVRLWELRAEEKHLRAELDAVEADHADLERELQEPAAMALERSAREKLDLQLPGEIVYRFPRIPADAGTEPAPAGSAHSDTESGEGVDTPESPR